MREGNLQFLFKNWHKEKHGYTQDDLINAFERGQENALSQSEEVIKKHIEQNIEKATNSAEELAKVIEKDFDISVIGMHMKIANMNEFSAILGISAKDYFSDVMENVYNYVDCPQCLLSKSRMSFRK